MDNPHFVAVVVLDCYEVEAMGEGVFVHIDSPLLEHNKHDDHGPDEHRPPVRPL